MVVGIRRATASRVALGTVPGTVRGVIRKATCKATRKAILGLVLAAIAVVSLRAIPAGTRCPIRKVTCFVVGMAIAEATLELKWGRTCGGIRRATPTVIPLRLVRPVWDANRPPASHGMGHKADRRRVCKPSSVPGKPGDGHLSGHAVARMSQATYPRT